jgi:hypothetical protein
LFGKDGVIFQFGDTFAHNDAGEYIGGTSCTAAVVQDPRSHPTVTTYALYNEGMVPSFIPLRPEEREQDLYGKRTTLWCFGGIIEVGETDGEVAAGWVFYQKGTQVSDNIPHAPLLQISPLANRNISGFPRGIASCTTNEPQYALCSVVFS